MTKLVVRPLCDLIVGLLKRTRGIINKCQQLGATAHRTFTRYFVIVLEFIIARPCY